MTDNQDSNLIAANAHELSDRKRNQFTTKDISAISKTLLPTSEELRGVRERIQELTALDEAKLIYQKDKEQIVLYRGTLSGYLNGMYFGCWCHMPGVRLFFNESKDLDTLPKAPEMKPARIRQFLDELDERLASDPGLYYIRIQMQSVRQLWEASNPNLNTSSSTNLVAIKLKEQLDAERKRKVSQQVSEAEAAKQRRLENEERTRLRKAQREAERLKRKKIAETTKRINAEAAKVAAERKAEEERIAQMQKEAEKQAREEAQREEIRRTTENMLRACDKHTDLPPVYDQDKDGNDCFYLKINNKVMHVVISETAPLCHQLNLEARTSTPLDVHDIQDVMTNINEHLNKNGDFDELLCNFALFYKKCQEIMNNESTLAKRQRTKVTKNPKGVIVPKHTVRPLYAKVCHRLMRPSTFNLDTGNQRQ